MWKFLIFALVAFAVYKMFVMDRKKSVENSDSKNEKMHAKGKMAKDPICGAYVSVGEDGIKVRDGEKVHRFCSYECRDAFLQKLREGGREIPEQTAKNDDDDE